MYDDMCIMTFVHSTPQVPIFKLRYNALNSSRFKMLLYIKANLMHKMKVLLNKIKFKTHNVRMMQQTNTLFIYNSLWLHIYLK